MEKQTLGEKIKKARVKKGITQRELATILGCTEVMISRYELGVSQISIPQLEKIANALNTPMGRFFDGVENSTASTSLRTRGHKNAFVFDLDDTLVDGRQFCGETIARVITAVDPSVNFELVCELHEKIRGKSIDDLYKEILKRIGTKADVEQLLKEDFIIQSENIDRMQIFDGVVDILEFLKKSGKKIYLCTNRKKALLDKVLTANHIEGYFDEIISCVDAGYKKPNPYCLIDLMKRTGMDPNEFIYFGDSEVDAHFAKNADIDHIIFDQYMNNKNLFKKLINMFLENDLVLPS